MGDDRRATDGPWRVVLAGGGTVALSLARSFSRRGQDVTVASHDPRDIAHRSRHVRGHVELPDPDREPGAYVQTLATRLGGPPAVVYPTTDATLLALSRHRERLGEHLLAAPSRATVEICLDKWQTYERAVAWDVPTPATVAPDSVQELLEHAKAFSFPCLVKPRHSHVFSDRFGCKMVAVHTEPEMVEVYQRSRDAGVDVVLQEIIPGGDDRVANHNAYAVDGQIHAVYTAQQVRSVPTAYGSPSVVTSAPVPELLPLGRELTQSLGMTGFACTEFKRDPRDGVFKLMEVNARHNLSSALGPAIGLDFAWIDHRYRTTGRVPDASTPTEGVTWIDLPRDLGATVTGRGAPGSVRDRWAAYRGPRVFAIWDRRDPLPFLRRLRTLITETGGRRRRSRALQLRIPRGVTVARRRGEAR